MPPPKNTKKEISKMIIDLPMWLHDDLKKASKLTGLFMNQFVKFAIQEKTAQILSEDVESDDFIPIGLRRKDR
jgi:hypothetical protein